MLEGRKFNHNFSNMVGTFNLQPSTPKLKDMSQCSDQNQHRIVLIEDLIIVNEKIDLVNQ